MARFFYFVQLYEKNMSIEIITSAEFSALLANDKKLSVLDVRSNFEFENMRLDYPTQHIEMHKITPDFERDAGKPLYILCKMGPRAHTIAKYLNANGHDNLIVIKGGTTECKEAGADMIEQDPPAHPQDIGSAAQQSFQLFMMRPDAH